MNDKNLVDSAVVEAVTDIFELDESEVADKLTPDMVDLWDSLNQLRLVTSLEQGLDITFSMEEIESIDTIGRLKELVRAHVDAS